jgi:hypothetical protein
MVAEHGLWSPYREAWTRAGWAPPAPIAPACAAVGSVIAFESVRSLNRIEEAALTGRFVTLDMRIWQSMVVDLHRHPDCPVCGAARWREMAERGSDAAL